MEGQIRIRALWADGWVVLRRGWRALLICQILFRTIAILLLAPLSVAVLNGLLGESVSIGNAALARFALSPAGALAIIVLPTLLLAEMLIEQALMVELAHDACERSRPSVVDAMWVMLWRLPRLTVLALLQVAIAAAIVLPGLVLTGLVYWTMLSGADINFYLSTRPPIFIAAAAIAGVIGLVTAAVLVLFYIRVFLSVPVAIFLDLPATAALRESARLSKGRRHEVAWAAMSWLGLRAAAIALALLLLRLLTLLVASRENDSLFTTMWMVAGLIVLAIFTIAIATAIDSAALATLITLLYRRLTDPKAGIHIDSAPAPHNIKRPLLLVAAAAVALLVTATHAFVLIERFTERRRVTVTAHRAGAIRAPENSLAALRLAISERADFAEIDVQRTSDGAIVVVHDRDLMRMAGSPMAISTSTAVQLKTADIGRLFSPAFTGERVGTLEEFIEESRGRIKLSIELKYYGRGDERLAGSVIETLRARNFLDQVSIISLEYAELARTRKIEPTLPLGFLVSASLGDLTKLDVNFISIAMSRFTPKLRRQADAKNLSIAVWTVNDRESMIRMLARGADDLVTDDPALAVATIKEYRDLSDVQLILLRFREWMRE